MRSVNSDGKTSPAFSWRSAAVVVLSLCLILCVLLPVLAATRYIVPVADDFSNSCDIMSIKGNHSYLWAAVKATADLYKTVGGYIFGAFINYLISPYLRWGIEGVRVSTMLCDLLYFFSLLYLVRVLLREGLDERRWAVALPIGALLIFCSVELEFHPEAYLWYCCSSAYLVPMALGFIGLGQFVIALKRGGTVHAVAAGILGMLAAETSLDVTALVCAFYLITAVWAFITKRKKSMPILVFCAVFLGAAVNVVAPGNFVRHGTISGKYGLGSILLMSLKDYFYRFKALISTPHLFLVLAALFLFGILVLFRKKKLSHFWPLLLLLGFAITGYLTVFPVVYGYESGYPDRCKFVTDNALLLSMFFWVLGFSGWCRSRMRDIDDAAIETTRVVSCVLLLCCCFSVFYCSVCKSSNGRWNYTSYPSIAILKSIRDGKMASFSDYWTGVLDEVSASTDKNIMVWRNGKVTNSYLVAPAFSEDGNNWVNESVIHFLFGNDAVQEGTTFRFFTSEAAYDNAVASAQSGG